MAKLSATNNLRTKVNAQKTGLQGEEKK